MAKIKRNFKRELPTIYTFHGAFDNEPYKANQEK